MFLVLETGVMCEISLARQRKPSDGLEFRSPQYKFHVIYGRLAFGSLSCPHVMPVSRQQVKIAQFPVPLPHIMVSNCWEVAAMEDKREDTESHEDREVRKLMKRIEARQAGLEAARDAETKRTLDDYRRTVGS